MNFFIIANAWSAGKDNPTSKHRIAMELVRQGHRVLWIEGSGMRTPSVGSSHDRLRMLRKVIAALRGTREEKIVSREAADPSAVRNEAAPKKTGTTMWGGCPHPPHPRAQYQSAGLWVLSPLFIPLPKYEFIRRLNGLICRWSMRFWGWRLGFHDPVLINYVPVLAEAMQRPHGRGDWLSVIRYWGRKSVPSTNNQQPTTNNRQRIRVVYHCVDRWDAFAMYDSAMMGEMDRRCCRYADLVIASAGELFDRCKAINLNTVLIPHGVDWEHFHRAVRRGKREISCSVAKLLSEETSGNSSTTQQPNNSTAFPSPIIGFFGLLSEWVDQELIIKLAQAFSVEDNAGTPMWGGCPHPPPVHAEIHLIGKADVDVSLLQGVPNIKLLGPQPFASLPGHIAGFTVGIIPFVVNDLTRSVNPIKLREMLSAGCPVVSTNLPEVARYAKGGKLLSCSVVELSSFSPTTVAVATTHDEFIAMVRRILERPLSPDERRALSDSMASETWTEKVREILGYLE